MLSLCGVCCIDINFQAFAIFIVVPINTQEFLCNRCRQLTGSRNPSGSIYYEDMRECVC